MIYAFAYGGGDICLGVVSKFHDPTLVISHEARKAKEKKANLAQKDRTKITARLARCIPTLIHLIVLTFCNLRGGAVARVGFIGIYLQCWCQFTSIFGMIPELYDNAIQILAPIQILHHL